MDGASDQQDLGHLASVRELGPAIVAAAEEIERIRDIHTLSQQMQGHAAHFETVGQIRMGMTPERSLFTF